MRPAGSKDKEVGWIIARADYLAMQAAKRWVTPFFVLQYRPHEADKPMPAAWRVGLTTSRKVGNAVARNRVRRRLRDLARRYLPSLAKPGHDLVLIGRTPAANVPFPVLLAAFEQALSRTRLGHKTGHKNSNKEPGDTQP